MGSGKKRKHRSHMASGSSSKKGRFVDRTEDMDIDSQGECMGGVMSNHSSIELNSNPIF